VYDFQHCSICRPSVSTVSKDTGIEPRTVATTALAVRRSNHSVGSHLNNKCLTFLHTQILRTTPHAGVLVPRATRRGGGGGDHSDPHRELERQPQQVCPGATGRSSTNRPDPPCHHLPSGPVHTVKKRLLIFPSPAGMSLTKLSLGGNNLIIPGQGEFD